MMRRAARPPALSPCRDRRRRPSGRRLAAVVPLVSSVALLAAAGCASVLPDEHAAVAHAEQDGVDAASGRRLGLEAITVPEGQRVMLIKSPDDVERVCSPRESDQGLSVSEGFSLSLPGAGGRGAGAGEQAGDRAVALHAPAIVQLARELLFRACELSLNLDADAAETKQIYERFLATLESIAPALTPTAAAADDDDNGDDDGDDDGDDGKDD